MNRSDSIVQWIAMAIMATCIAIGAALTNAMTAEAGRAQLVYTDEAQEGDPPEVALGIAMGAFRGLFVNYLWMRANTLKEEGKYYEAIELSKAITRLQPRFPRVWAFHAWNMAYNISVATNTASERWTWVKSGIDLLRNQALRRNPNDTLLHKELAWIFIHKIQGWSDDANHYYKKQVARDWHVVLGAPPDRQFFDTRVDAIDGLVDWLTPISDAPRTYEALIEREANALALDGVDAATPHSRIEELVDRIRRDTGLEPGFELLKMVALNRAYRAAWYAQQSQDISMFPERIQTVGALLDDEQYADAWDRLLPYVRRLVLSKEYNMEPERMARYTQRYGPLDWRHPGAHSLYWSVRGVEEGLERQGVTQFSTLNTDRVTLHSIQELFRFGDIQFDLLTEDYFTLPNFDFIDTYGTTLEQLRPRGGFSQDDQAKGFTTYSAGYENFLREVIRILYNRGDIEGAEHYHMILRTAPWRNENDPDVSYELGLTLAEFVDNQLKDRITIPHVANSEIEAALHMAFLEGALGGKRGVFRKQMEYAQKAWQAYREYQDVRTTPDAEANRMWEFIGENFAEIVIRSLTRLLLGGRVGTDAGGAGTMGPTQAATLYQKVPPDLQRAVYDDLVAEYVTRRQVEKPAFDSLFPEPEGMEQWRELIRSQNLNSDEWFRRQIEFTQQ
jgi:hypothetical protein